MKRLSENYVELPEKRRRGRLKSRYLGVVKEDMQVVEMREGEV